MKHHVPFIALFIILSSGCQNFRSEIPAAVYKEGIIKAKMIDTLFYYGDSHYHAIIHASDGNVYYVINSHNLESGARMFRYNPKTDDLKMLADFTDLLGYDRTKVVCQGKVHCDFFEYEDKLYFGTHCGTYESEELGIYPGGHYMVYDLVSGEFRDLGMGEPQHGILSMAMDRKRGRLYSMGWPAAKFHYYDIESGEVTRFGRSVIFTPEEYMKDQAKRYYENINEQKEDPRSIDDPYEKRILTVYIPRSFGINPNTGNVYWHNINGTLARYNYAKDTVEQVKEPTFDVPILQIPLPQKVRNYWRSIRWNDATQRFYGSMYYSDYLFSFDPKTKEVEILDRICAGPDRKSGDTTFSSLGFELSEDGRTVYYIGRDEIKNRDGIIQKEELHLVTYDIMLRRYTDHGVIELDDGRRPRYCQSLEIGKDGNLYLVCWVNYTDLESEKGKRIVAARYSARPDEDKGKPVAEINLVVLKNPLM